MPLWKQAGVGALFVTAMELVVGIPLNLMLGLHIWDYSSIQSIGPNLPAVYSVMVLPCAAVHFC